MKSSNKEVEQLKYEANEKPKAAIAAFIAGFFTLVSPVVTAVGLGDRPSASWINALGRLPESGPINNLPSLRTPLFAFYNDHIEAVFAGAIVSAIGFLALGWAVAFLARAVIARNSKFPSAWRIAVIVGAVVSAVSVVVLAAATSKVMSDYVAGAKTVKAANDVMSGTLIQASGYINLLTTLVLAVGIIFVALNAMRTGLLTRFTGIIGVVSGGLLLLASQGIPLAAPMPLVLAFWLISLGVLYLDRWPKGTPPAWTSGKAEPWPPRQPPASRQGRADKNNLPEGSENEGGKQTKPSQKKKGGGGSKRSQGNSRQRQLQNSAGNE